jgi:hypothetical protein
MGEKFNVEKIIDLVSSENKEKILKGLDEVSKNIDFIPPEAIEEVISS